MKGVGVAFAGFLNIPFEWGITIGVAIVFFYAVLGGMKGITYTQVAQYCVLIFAYLVPAIFISVLMVGNPVPQLGLGSALSDGTYLLDKLDQVVTDLGFREYTTSHAGKVDLFFVTAALMLDGRLLRLAVPFTLPQVGLRDELYRVREGGEDTQPLEGTRQAAVFRGSGTPDHISDLWRRP
jgi:cation/acetate symporter